MIGEIFNMSSILPTFPADLDERYSLNKLLNEYVTIVGGASHIESLLGEEAEMAQIGKSLPSSLQKEIDSGRTKIRSAQMLSNTLGPDCITPEVKNKWINVLTELKEKAEKTPKTTPRKIEQIDSYITMFKNMKNICVDDKFPSGNSKVEEEYY